MSGADLAIAIRQCSARAAYIRGGVKLGDVITEFDGKTVSDALDLPIWIARTPLGKQVQLKIQREQREMDLNLTVAELPQGPMPRKDIG